MVKATKIFIELKELKTRVRTRQRNALTADLIILYSLERSAPHMDLCAQIVRKKITGQGFAAPEAKVKHVVGKGTKKTLSHVIMPGVKTDVTDGGPQAENVEMEIKEN